jgi:hypothetical protein
MVIFCGRVILNAAILSWLEAEKSAVLFLMLTFKEKFLAVCKLIIDHVIYF